MLLDPLCSEAFSSELELFLPLAWEVSGLSEGVLARSPACEVAGFSLVIVAMVVSVPMDKPFERHGPCLYKGEPYLRIQI
jgi:hypothetical protein